MVINYYAFSHLALPCLRVRTLPYVITSHNMFAFQFLCTFYWNFICMLFIGHPQFVFYYNITVLKQQYYSYLCCLYTVSQKNCTIFILA